MIAVITLLIAHIGFLFVIESWADKRGLASLLGQVRFGMIILLLLVITIEVLE